MEKRAILAIILTFLVILLWSFIQGKFFPQSPPPKEVSKEQVAPTEKKITKEIDLKENTLTGEKLAPRKKVSVKKEVTVETQNYWAVFTSDDARLKHFRLKQYNDRVEESVITIKLVRLVKNILGYKQDPSPEPKPLDLVNTDEKEGLPLGLTFTPALPSSDEENWDVDQTQLRLLKTGQQGEVVFTKSLENGLKVAKQYRFYSEKNRIDIDVVVENPLSKGVDVQTGLEWVGRVELDKFIDKENKDFGLKYSFLKNQKVERKDLGGTGSAGCTPGCGTPKRRIEPFETTDKGDIRWYSFEGEYFTALLIPPASEQNLTLAVKGDGENLMKATLITSPTSVSSGQSVKIPFQVYLGSKDENLLKELGVEAEKLVDFGFFTIIAKPLLWILRFTHNATKNFGLDIIILSILIKIIFLPLTQISFKSMKEMQKVQPEMARLKEQYKNDKARLQQEIMLLYKRRKINPMSGCLPMIIQIPVFIALYNALQNATEMRHAPFFLWIQDLSAKDPIYITPIIMGASMVIQQKMTPTAADPAQAKLFLLMPVMFTFLFLNFPSGLVLYWLVTNVLSIAHQYYLNKR